MTGLDCYILQRKKPQLLIPLYLQLVQTMKTFPNMAPITVQMQCHYLLALRLWLTRQDYRTQANLVVVPFSTPTESIMNLARSLYAPLSPLPDYSDLQIGFAHDEQLALIWPS
jgi:hypothetical protein